MGIGFQPLDAKSQARLGVGRNAIRRSSPFRTNRVKQSTISSSVHPGPFPATVAIDTNRSGFLAYGVSGTPTFVLVDGDGRIRSYSTGYAPDKGIGVDGWSWSKLRGDRPGGVGQGASGRMDVMKWLGAIQREIRDGSGKECRIPRQLDDQFIVAPGAFR
jgi:hypothetical protein